MMRDNITLAGNYTQFGNLTKSANETSTLESKGKSVADVLTEILSKRLQPTITASERRFLPVWPGDRRHRLQLGGAAHY